MSTSMIYLDGEFVNRHLTPEVCIPLVREAMIKLSAGTTIQAPRTILPLQEGRAFGVMQGALGAATAFGAKIVSVFPDNFENGLQSHQGLVLLFDAATGAPCCLLHAGEVTAIRTAAASAWTCRHKRGGRHA